jgi:4-amino-4-deoxy-L-arabinose transferase-like glycosyltransferase
VLVSLSFLGGLYAALKAYSMLFARTCKMSLPTTVFLATRIALVLICYESTALFGKAPAYLWELGRHWDANYYLEIAGSGYFLRNDFWSTAPFYPLFPFLIRTVSILTNSGIAAGVIISNLAFLGSLHLLYRMAREHWGEGVARRSVILMAIWPVSFFMSAIYTEATFLLLCLAFFWFAGKKKWAIASACAAGAALTRPVGFILAPVALLIYGQQAFQERRGVRLDIAWLVLVPLALALFGLVLYGAVGDPVANTKAQEAWQRKPLQNPLLTIQKALSGSELSLRHMEPMRLQWNLERLHCLVGALLALLSVIFIAKRLGISYAIFTALGMLIPLSSGLITCTLRYAQVLFPLSMILGVWTEDRRIFYALALGSAIFMAFFAVMFVNDFLMT